MMRIDVTARHYLSLIISGILFVVAMAAIAVFGLKPGIDFTTGSLMELSFPQGKRPTVDEAQARLAPLNLGTAVIQPTEADGLMIRLRTLTQPEHERILEIFRSPPASISVNEGKSKVSIEPVGGSGTVASGITVGSKTDLVNVIEKRFETIGPSVSKSLRNRSLATTAAVIAATILFIALSFRRVSRPIASWKYGIVAIVALLHDLGITTGLFAVLGYFQGVEIDIPFVVAMLTVFGYSVNDTIVVFDRIREKLIRRGTENFADTVNVALNETLARSLNTSFTSLLVLVGLFFFGGETIHYFALALIVGIASGAYSSIFVASPLLILWEKWGRRGR